MSFKGIISGLAGYVAANLVAKALDKGAQQTNPTTAKYVAGGTVAGGLALAWMGDRNDNNFIKSFGIGIAVSGAGQFVGIDLWELPGNFFKKTPPPDTNHQQNNLPAQQTPGPEPQPPAPAITPSGGTADNSAPEEEEDEEPEEQDDSEFA